MRHLHLLIHGFRARFPGSWILKHRRDATQRDQGNMTSNLLSANVNSTRIPKPQHAIVRRVNASVRRGQPCKSSVHETALGNRYAGQSSFVPGRKFVYDSQRDQRGARHVTFSCCQIDLLQQTDLGTNGLRRMRLQRTARRRLYALLATVIH